MSQRISEQLAEAIAAFDANPNPTPEQTTKLLGIHREMLSQLLDFSRDFEQASTVHPRCVPLWGGAGAAARFYRWLQVGQRRPTMGMGETVVRLASRSRA